MEQRRVPGILMDFEINRNSLCALAAVRSNLLGFINKRIASQKWDCPYLLSTWEAAPEGLGAFWGSSGEGRAWQEERVEQRSIRE